MDYRRIDDPKNLKKNQGNLVELCTEIFKEVQQSLTYLPMYADTAL